MRRRLLITAASLLACLAGAAVANDLNDDGPMARQETDPGRPGTAAMGARAADPAGGPAWAVRSHETEGGRLCVELGRTDGEHFGRAEERGAIAERPPNGHGVCRAAEEEEDQIAIAQFAESGDQGPRTILFGRLAARGSRLSLRRDGRETAVDVAKDRTFVLPMAGRIDPQELPVEVTGPDGARRHIDWR